MIRHLIEQSEQWAQILNALNLFLRKLNIETQLFVERKGKAASMRALELDDFGRVKNWPEGFFGDAVGETREQARLMFTRQQEPKA